MKEETPGQIRAETQSRSAGTRGEGQPCSDTQSNGADAPSEIPGHDASDTHVPGAGTRKSGGQAEDATHGSSAPASAKPNGATDFETTSEMAKFFLESAGGEWQEARRLMEDTLLSQPNLFQKFVLPIVREAVIQWVTGCDMQTRKSFWGDAKPDRASKDGALERVAMRNIYDWPLAGGKPLGDATKEELLENAEWNIKTARTRMLNAQWLKLIAGKLRGKKPVRKQLSEEQIVELRRIAESRAKVDL